MWCGYDHRMRLGVEEFSHGVDASIRSKAVERDASVAEQIITEQDHLFALERYLEETLNTKDLEESVRLRARGFLGLVMLSRYLIGMEPQSEASEGGVFSVLMTERSHEITDLIRDFDDAYENVIPQNTSHIYKLSKALERVNLLGVPSEIR
jgi:hypothetical protein